MEKKDRIKDRKRYFIHRPGKGFTMVELIVVLYILAILAKKLLLCRRCSGYIDNSKGEKEYIAQAESGVDFYTSCIDRGYNDGNNRLIQVGAKKAKEVTRERGRYAGILHVEEDGKTAC